MRRRQNRGSIVANPVLVGAVTTLVVVVAVFLAYNANNGLPFVPTRSVKVQISNGANLVRGNEVRSGGFRIGVVEDMKPVRLPSGKVGAELSLKLDKKIGAVPVDSSVVIRPRSALGLKYVEFEKGSSKRVLPDGATLPASRAKVPVELDEFFNIFDAKTRRASQQNLEGFGNAFTGRGADLNRFIAGAPELFGVLRPVMANLADPRTHLEDFFKELGDAARIVAPVSETNAHLFTTMANTFEAFSRDPQALKDTISKSPPTLDVSTRSLRVQRPFLDHTTAFSRDFAAATGELRGALPPLNRALKIGTPVTTRSIELNDELQGAMSALQKLAEAPTTNGALRGLTATITTLQPQLRYLGPYVTVCNSWNSFWTFAAEHFTAPDSTGGSERALLNGTPQTDPTDQHGNDDVNAMGANEFAHGYQAQDHSNGRQDLHANFYGSAINPDGTAQCEAGQQGYAFQSNPYRDRGVQGDPYRRVNVDHPAIDRSPPVGPTYKQFNKQGKGEGLNRGSVPEGQTYTWRPGGRALDTPLPVAP
jgi:virulence factor Mce-like protein